MRLNSIPFQDVGTANAAAVATVTNTADDHRLRLKFLVASYSATPTGGKLTISDGDDVDWQIDLLSTTPLVLPLPPDGLQLGPGATLTVTLAAGGSSVVGKVNGYCSFE